MMETYLIRCDYCGRRDRPFDPFRWWEPCPFCGGPMVVPKSVKEELKRRPNPPWIKPAYPGPPEIPLVGRLILENLAVV